MKFALALFILYASTCVLAAEIKLATITTDIDKDTTVFYLQTQDDGSVDGLRYVTTTVSGQITEDLHFSYEEVMAGNIVMEERNGYEVVKLNVDKFSREQGGIVKLNYLFNGMTHAWKEIRLHLVREGQKYFLTDLNNNKITRIFFKGNFIRIIGLVGVKEIQTSGDNVLLK